MKLLNISIQDNRGFTLTEILITLGLIAAAASFGLFITMNLYTGYRFNYEQNNLVSILQRARSQAMANVNQSAHGVCLTGDNYVLFEGTSCAAGEEFPKAPSVSVTMPTIVFAQLTGDCTTCTSGSLDIVLTEQTETGTITINHEGRINW